MRNKHFLARIRLLALFLMFSIVTSGAFAAIVENSRQGTLAISITSQPEQADISTDLHQGLTCIIFNSMSAGGFITKDPIGFMGDSNLYRYANSNPVIYTDPLGLFDVLLYDNTFGEASKLADKTIQTGKLNDPKIIIGSSIDSITKLKEILVATQKSKTSKIDRFIFLGHGLLAEKYLTTEPLRINPTLFLDPCYFGDIKGSFSSTGEAILFACDSGTNPNTSAAIKYSLFMGVRSTGVYGKGYTDEGIIYEDKFLQWSDYSLGMGYTPTLVKYDDLFHWAKEGQWRRVVDSSGQTIYSPY